jgi:hypothetical protein
MNAVLPAHPLRAAARGLLLWLVGMIVGSLVFAVPTLKAAPAIPYVTTNPFITLPILVLWAALVPALARGLTADARTPEGEGLRVGAIFLAVNVLLDAALVVGAMNAGLGFYAHLGPWVAYSLLLLLPWRVGRAAVRGPTARAADSRGP